MYLKDSAIQAAKNIFIRFPKRLIRFIEFCKEYKQFTGAKDDRFSVKIRDLYPCLTDRIRSTPFDEHYTYHPAWAARILAKTMPELHADFSSILCFSTMLSAFIPVRFYDYRPADIKLSNWEGGFADLCKLNFADSTFQSVSCMHTVEHIGLGRYGDKVDPAGDAKAISELKRITAVGGDILLVTPVGKPRIEFNAHRIYSYELIMRLFEGCDLIEFSLIPDEGGLIENADPSLVSQQSYGCGCFWFRKNKPC